MNEIAKKYGMLTLSEALASDSDTDEETVKEDWYKTLLSATDHVPAKLTEELFETLSSLTVTNFIPELLRFVKSSVAEYGGVMTVRKQCRNEIRRLEMQDAKENKI